MAAISETFSIREFVMTMRSVDVTRCWPFDGGIPRTGRVEDDGSLPPMTCRKFRWWSSERARIAASHQERSTRTESENRSQDLETGGGDDGGEEGGFEDEEDDGAGRPTSADGQDDGSPGDGRRRAKFKVPKKRSIVDIFAHTPEVGGDDGGDGAAVEENNMDKKMKALTPTKKLTKIKKRKRRKKKVLTMKKGSKKKNGGVGKKVVTKRKKSADGENVDVEAAKVKKKKKKMMMVETVMDSVLASTPCATDAKAKFQPPRAALPDHSSGTSKEASSSRQLGKAKVVVTAIKKNISTNKRKILKKDRLKSIHSHKQTWEHQQNKSCAFPSHSILKTQTKASPVQRTSASHEKGHNLGISCTSQVQQSVRHVRFSGKDDILGQKDMDHPFMDTLQLKVPAKEFSEVVSASSLPKPSHLATETDGVSEVMLPSKDVDADCGSGKANALAVEGDRSRFPDDSIQVRDFHHIVAVDSDVLCHSRSSTGVPETSPLEYVDLNQASDSSCTVSLQYTVHHANHNQQECLSIDRTNQEVGTQTGESIPWMSNVNKRMQTLDRITLSDVTVSIPCLSRSMNSSLAGSSKGTSMGPTFLKPHLIQPGMPGPASCLLHYQSSCALPTKDPTAWGCSAPMLNQLFPVSRESWMPTKSLESIPDTVKLSRERFANDDFIGLPLNSHGGLTQMHDQILRKHTLVSGPTNTFPLCNTMEAGDDRGHSNDGPGAYKHDFKFFSNKRPHKMNGLLNVASQTKSNSLELKDLEQTETDLESTILLGFGSRQTYQSLDHKGKEKSNDLENFGSAFQSDPLPTVRLMGKTVTVGRSSEVDQGSKDPIMWSDKEVIAQHTLPFTVSNNLVRNQSLEPEQIIHPAPEPMLAALSFNHKPQLVPKDSLSSVMGRIGSKYHNASHSVASHTAVEHPMQIPGTQLTGKEPTHASHPRSTMLSGSSPAINHAGHVNYRTASAIGLPLATPDCQAPFQFSCPRLSTPYMPPWLLSSTIKEPKMPSSSQTHSGPTCRRYLCSLPNSGFSPSEQYTVTPLSSSLHKPRLDSALLAPYHGLVAPSASHNLSSSHSFPEHARSFSSLHNPQLLQGYPGSEPGCSFIASGGSICSIGKKRKSGLRPGSNCTSQSKKLKKKHNVTANANGNTSESPSFRKTEAVKSQTGITKKKQQQEYLHYDASAPVLNICRDGQVGSGLYGSMNCFKTSPVTRPGPIKLSAGAKHILKPGQKMDKINSTLTHSTLPFAGKSSSKGLDTKKKIARIYKF
ncbi:uncharacterized protein LOC116261882 [Nymphaea colorata]|nr:uncharacterized protein LOC116261882 [Nymphaea colorata]